MYQIDFHLDSIRICAGNATSAPLVWYEEPIVIEPEKNMSSQAIVRMFREYRIGQHGKSLTRIHLTRILLLAERRCFRIPNEGTFPAAASVTNFT